MPSSPFASNTVLVVAHPDDEILWFSGVLNQVEETVICYTGLNGNPFLARARHGVARRYPLGNVRWLHLDQPGAFLGADWENMQFTASGLPRLNRKVIERATERGLIELVDKLNPILGRAGHVVTHNPWGEYGHEEHLLVRRAVEILSDRHGFVVWTTNYASSHSIRHATRFVAGGARDYHTLPTNSNLAREIMALYRDEGCWTWWDEYAWFEKECYARIDARAIDSSVRGQLFPINYLQCDYFPSYKTPLQLRRQRLRRAVTWPLRRVRKSLSTGRRLTSPGRRTFEESILPYFSTAPDVKDILFVGCDWYTQGYVREFRHKRFVTLEIDPMKARFGNPSEHVSDSLLNASAHLAPSTFDVVLLNGVFGWGINDAAETKEALRVVRDLLRPSGRLVVGWNDVAQYRPGLLPEKAVVGMFDTWDFPPLKDWQYRVPSSQLSQVYDFYTARAESSRSKQ